MFKYIIKISFDDGEPESVDNLKIIGGGHTVVMNLTDPVPRKTRYKVDLYEVSPWGCGGGGEGMGREGEGTYCGE